MATEQQLQAGAKSLARQEAAKAWCAEKTKHLVMNVDLADEFAKILDVVWSQPWLGNASTSELHAELEARARMGGYADYRTVDAT